METKRMNVQEAIGTSTRMQLNILKGNARFTGSYGKGGDAFNSKYRSGEQMPGKFTAFAKLIDYIFINKSVNSVFRKNGIYGEVTVDGTIYKFTADILNPGEWNEPKSVKIAYSGDSLPEGKGYELLPLFLLAIRDESEYEETNKFFGVIKNILVDEETSGGVLKADEIYHLQFQFRNGNVEEQHFVAI